MNLIPVDGSDPILSCQEASELEQSVLDSEAKVWDAMTRVGRKLGQGILKEYAFSRYKANSLFVVGLIGKGHNGGDALLAIGEMVRAGSVDRVLLILGAPQDQLKPHTSKALKSLRKRLPEASLSLVAGEEDGGDEWTNEVQKKIGSTSIDVCVDGLIGMQFRPPVRPLSRQIIEFANALPDVRLRVAVDLPSGMGDESGEVAFEADATFATGVFKRPLLIENPLHSIGSIRYLDIGLFGESVDSRDRVIKDSVLDCLRRRRPAQVDKRGFGHLYILAGSRQMPGALVMSVRAALQSGVGLITVCAPQSLVPVLAPLIPEAMWLPWPENPSGGLSTNGLDNVGIMRAKASALLIGPGMGSDPETLRMLVELLKRWTGALVIDADALQTRVLNWVQGKCVVTPHMGEFQRLIGVEGTLSNVDHHLRELAREHSVVAALKGPLTRITDGEHLFVNTTGNSVLARGGSGDLLAGLTAGLLAQSPNDVLGAACRAVYWHGRSADLLAGRRGQTAVRTTDLLEYLDPALGEDNESLDD